MDLEEELSLSNQDVVNIDQPNELTTSLADGNDDLLGLDTQIKLTARAKIAKIDNERIFDRNKGLNYIIKNSHKISKSIKRNDKNLAKTLSHNSQFSSSKKRQAKFDNEVDNLSSVLQFYQLWCHGLFSKARFKDCLHLVRALGSKSSQLKLYRRELLDLEIRKLKVKNGLLDEDEINKNNMDETEKQVEEKENDVDDHDDWSFMHVNNNASNNNLFVGDDDIDENELYGLPKKKLAASSAKEFSPEPNNLESGSNKVSVDTSKTGDNSESDDPFSDDDDLLISQTQQSKNIAELDPSEEFIGGNNTEDDYANEMEIMREMGL